MEDLENKLMVTNMVALKFAGICLGCSLQPDPDKPNKSKMFKINWAKGLVKWVWLLLYDKMVCV